MEKWFVLEALDFGAAPAAEFSDWCDLEMVRSRRKLSGVLSVDRWLAYDNPKISVVTLDAEASENRSPQLFGAIREGDASPLGRRIAGLVATVFRFQGKEVWSDGRSPPSDIGGLSIAAMNVDPTKEAEFLEWYDREHLPGLSAVPGVLSARRFEAVGESERKYMAVYRIAGPEVPRSEGWQACNKSAGTVRMLPHFRNPFVLRARCYARDM